MSRTLKIALSVVLVAAVMGGAYLALRETEPEVAFDLGLVRASMPYASRLLPDGSFASSATITPGEALGKQPSGTPSGDRLVIPRIALDLAVVRGNDISALRRGLWLQPPCALPGDPGAAVIAGHRIATQFSLLPKLSVGDPVVLFFRGVEFDYRVSSVSVLDATRPDAGPGKPGDPSSLVLYTCTPRWNGDKRVVVYCSRVL